MSTYPTTDQIELMKSPELLKAFNELAPAAGQNRVLRFATRSAGIKRLTAVVEALAARDAKGKPPVGQIDWPLTAAAPTLVVVETPTGVVVGTADVVTQTVEEAIATIKAEAPEPAATPEPTGARLSVADKCRETIRDKSFKDDAARLAAVRAYFPEKTVPGNAITYYREHLTPKRVRRA